MIRNHAAAGTGKPLFMYLAMQDVHEPVNAPARYVAMQDPVIQDSTRRTYGGMVSAVDESLANLTETLREQNMWNNTILIV